MLFKEKDKEEGNEIKSRRFDYQTQFATDGLKDDSFVRMLAGNKLDEKELPKRSQSINLVTSNRSIKSAINILEGIEKPGDYEKGRSKSVYRSGQLSKPLDFRF